MKKKFDLRIIAIITILMMGICGCTINNTKSPNNIDSKVTLNERQKSILAEEGLPTDYEELNRTQKAAIVAIEEMLEAIETKYGMEFCYAGYIQANVLESETLIAYPAGGTASIDSFSITRSSDGTLTDDYMNVALRAGYSELVLSLAKDTLSSENVKVFVEVTKTTLTSVPDTEEQLVGNVEGISLIFIDGSIMSSEQFGTFVSSMKQIFEEKQMYGTVNIILLNDDTLKNLAQNNYTDYLDPSCYTERDSIHIKK